MRSRSPCTSAATASSRKSASCSPRRGANSPADNDATKSGVTALLSDPRTSARAEEIVLRRIDDTSNCRHFSQRNGLRLPKAVNFDGWKRSWSNDYRSRRTIRAGFWNSRRNGIASCERSAHSRVASTTTARRRCRGWRRSRSLTFRCPWNSCSLSVSTPSRSPRWAMFTCPMLTMPCVRSFIGQVNGLTRISLRRLQSGGHEERRTLAFRDFLREHGDVAREYVTLKKHLATLVNAAESSSRETYANAKSEFIDRVGQMALAAGLPRGL